MKKRGISTGDFILCLDQIVKDANDCYTWQLFSIIGQLHPNMINMDSERMMYFGVPVHLKENGAIQLFPHIVCLSHTDFKLLCGKSDEFVTNWHQSINKLSEVAYENGNKNFQHFVQSLLPLEDDQLNISLIDYLFQSPKMVNLYKVDAEMVVYRKLSKDVTLYLYDKIKSFPKEEWTDAGINNMNILRYLSVLKSRIKTIESQGATVDTNG